MLTFGIGWPAGMETSIKEVMKQENEESQLEHADMEIKKMENMLNHKEEIMSRPVCFRGVFDRRVPQ